MKKTYDVTLSVLELSLIQYALLRQYDESLTLKENAVKNEEDDEIIKRYNSIIELLKNTIHKISEILVPRK